MAGCIESWVGGVQQSFVIEVDGIFIGAAVPVLDGFRFHAVHPRVGDLGGCTWRSLSELRRAAGHRFITGQDFWHGSPNRPAVQGPVLQGADGGIDGGAAERMAHARCCWSTPG